ncbi:MAG: DUF1614 domain-containing protein [Archaeoglobaceae archaeon]|nr:DUF1614 domain-containing protein [Archaeoglobaceae archaeon]MDW8014149.1 DUF1614 domain-containing protein [Archaeoglobaceae archaeon]
MRDYIFPPLHLPFFLIFILLPLFLTFLLVPTVFQVLFGVEKEVALLLFLLIVIGSFINIPVYKKPATFYSYQYNVFGIIYYVVRKGKIVVAVNLGGCIFPSILAFKAFLDTLIFINFVYFFIFLALATILSYAAAKPVRHVGIVMPMLFPVLIAISSSILVVFLSSAPLYVLPKLSFTIGVFSTILGADILHLKDIEKIGEGVVSIGGAGTFDGIFLTGIFSALVSILMI